MRTSLTIALILSLATSIASAQPAPKATVTLKKLTEKRELSLEKTPFSGWGNGIELKLHIDGPDVKGARKYGKVTVTKATDDAGTDLTKAGDGPTRSSDDFQEIREPMSFGQDENKPKPSGFEIDLELPTPSARSAKTIKEVTGSLQVLVGGEKKVIAVKPIAKNLGKAVEDPALKSLGVTFELIDPSKKPAGQKLGGAIFGSGEKGKSVTAIIGGKIDNVAEVRIVDASGEKLNRSSMWSDDDGKRTINYDVEKPLTDADALEIEVWPGQKSLTVPISLKDVKLP